MARLERPGVPTASLLLLFASVAAAHKHHMGSNKVVATDGGATTSEPIDAILWIHIFTQMIAYGIVFPIGMVLGMTKSRWHVPTQIFGSCLALLGFFLGHIHGGREFSGDNVHSSFASILQLLLIGQIVLGLYLKGHWERGVNGRIRKFIRPCHSIIGKAMPVLSWTQMIFGGITSLGFCQGDHLGQCLAHFIMGSAFIAYAILLTIILVVGQMWMRRCGRSQEFFDSAVIAAWGCVNTFTEHRWGTAWVRNDWQHTTMGIIWWCAGLAGMFLSRDRDGNPKRNFIPGFVIFITGWAMSAHPQELMVSAMTHSMFGKTLMAAGLTRVIEIAFVLRDKQSIDEDGGSWNSFQYVPVFLLYAAGFLFLGATEEQMALVHASALDGVSYILILYSLAFLVFMFANMLVHLYYRLASVDSVGKKGAVSIAEQGRLRDAEEFELDGLMSDDDGEERRGMLRSSEDHSSLDTPSTLGKNNEASVQ